MRRLDLAHSDTISAREAYDVPRPRPAGRPWLGVCMVSSLDGSAVVDERSSALSSDADRAVLSALRAAADLIIVGAGTVRIERYGPPKKPGQRIGVVSRTGDLDLTLPLFTSGAGFLILPDDAPAHPVDTVRAGVGELDLAGALAQLDADFVQAEGGPGLNGALLAADLVDELNLTISPQLVGGDGPRIATGAPATPSPMRLVHVLEQDGFLFTRSVRR